MLNRKNFAKTMVASALTITILTIPVLSYIEENEITDPNQQQPENLYSYSLEVNSQNVETGDHQHFVLPKNLDYIVIPANDNTYFIWTKDPLGTKSQKKLLEGLNSQNGKVNFTKENTYFDFVLGDCVIKTLQFDEKGQAKKLYPTVTAVTVNQSSSSQVSNSQIVYVPNLDENGEIIYDNPSVPEGGYEGIYVYDEEKIGAINLNNSTNQFNVTVNKPGNKQVLYGTYEMIPTLIQETDFSMPIKK